MTIGVAGVRLLLIALAAAPAAPQTASFRVDTRVVEVPVVVRDRRSGAAVRGLTAADFVLLEAGKPQRIEFFSAHQSPIRQERSADGQADERLATGIFSNRRYVGTEATPVVAVLIDGYNARYEDQYYAAKAAMEVIERKEVAAQWGVYFLGRFGVRVLHDYSTDTESVVSRLRSLRAAGNSAEGLGAGPESVAPSLSTEIERKASNGAGQAEEYRRLVTTLSAIRDIGRHLSALPGRKSLVWLTTGISLRAVVQVVPHLWHQTLDTLNDANVAVYSIDSQGVRTAAGFLAETPTRDLQLRPGRGSPMGPTEVMGAISESTGGLSFINSNNLAKGVQEALADSRTFYRLAYRATHGKWDGRQVALEVKVPGRRGVDVRYRRSYVARPLAPMAQPARDRLLADAIVSPLEAVEVGITARLSPVEGSEESMLRLTLDPGSVTLSEEAGQYRGRFDVRCVQTSAESKVLDDFTDEVNLNLKPADAERTHGEGFNYQRKLRIRHESRVLKIAFCDHVTGRLGTLRIELHGLNAIAR
ncbi:MAG: VWA domain-containing protein [Acidobacteria bacterium]|nr:VWA domain-containing protein [Acidobacteriota bacterium]